MADKGLQNAIHGSGFYHKKHSKYQDAAYKKKVHDTMASLRSKRTTQFAKGSDEAKAHMAKLRAMRKSAQKNVTVRSKKPKAKFEDIEEGEIVDGSGIRGSKSKTRPGRLDYETHKGDKYYHQGNHLVAGNPYANY